MYRVSLCKKLLKECDFISWISVGVSCIFHPYVMKHVRSALSFFLIGRDSWLCPTEYVRIDRRPFAGAAARKLKFVINSRSFLLIFRAVNPNPSPDSSYYSTGVLVRLSRRYLHKAMKCIRPPSENKQRPIGSARYRVSLADFEELAKYWEHPRVDIECEYRFFVGVLKIIKSI